MEGERYGWEERDGWKEASKTDDGRKQRRRRSGGKQGRRPDEATLRCTCNLLPAVNQRHINIEM